MSRRQMTISEAINLAKQAGLPGNVNLAQLQRLTTHMSCKQKIEDTYARMGREMTALQQWKREHGYCAAGLSCLVRTESWACDEHVKENRVPRKSTAYGDLRKVEKLAMSVQKSSQKRSKKRAA